MDSEQLGRIGTSLSNVAAGIAERLRHEGASARAPYNSYEELIDLEVRRLRGEGQEALADALAALRNPETEASNG